MPAKKIEVVDPSTVLVSAPKRARRAPAVRVDLTHPGARKAILAVHPRVVHHDSILRASPEEERAARAYLAARDEAKALETAKEINGNALAVAIGDHEGIEGETWRATWGDKRGTVDWDRLAADFGISEAVLDHYRRPSTRTLNVTAKGE